jgi:hypothetical protein
MARYIRQLIFFHRCRRRCTTTCVRMRDLEVAFTTAPREFAVFLRILRNILEDRRASFINRAIDQPILPDRPRTASNDASFGHFLTLTKITRDAAAILDPTAVAKFDCHTEVVPPPDTSNTYCASNRPRIA